MIGRPGCGLLQMNGQPTAENTRECGADGDLPGFRNWANPQHIEQLAQLWNVDQLVIPHWAPPTHAMQLWRYAEQGSIDFLWISATNPAVSLPELPRIRDILSRDELFVVVQDGFLTETAQYADVVLPAALWGEKQGTFTNASRTVHLSEQAVAPPGAARSDLDIFLDYARRMDLRDRDGRPLIGWTTPEEAFEAWKDCSRGRPCDYSGLSYDKLRGGSGIPWPCTPDAPGGTDRLYVDARFPTDPEDCEDFGHDLLTGGSTTPEKYRAKQPDGRAFLRSAEFTEPPEWVSPEYPLIATTGRSPYHFHTRTKTGRSRRLRAAEPAVWVELSAQDAQRFGIGPGERVRVESARGAVEAEARIGEPREGVVFLPFHFGYWDNPDGPPTAANELTVTAWDPVSKQPMFKVAAVRVRKVV
jgi:anaerobic selenocysteine-containing dehydrogenase